MNRRILLFAGRNMKEILRDPVNLFFALGFPVVFLLLLSALNSGASAQADNPVFHMESLTPGIVAFAPVFMALFSGMLLAKDRTSSFLMRLFTSPITSADFLFGYTLPMVIVAMVQSSITFLAAVLFGFHFTGNVLLAVIVVIPITLFFVAVGLLCGSVMSDKAVGGVCGALLTIVAGWFGGIWFPLELIGGWFAVTAKILPFYHAAQAAAAAVNGNYGEILFHIAVVTGYAIVLFVVAVFVFNRKMKSDHLWA